VKYLLDQLQHTYNELTDKNEINIFRKYGSYAKRYTIVILCKIIALHATYNCKNCTYYLRGVLFIAHYIYIHIHHIHLLSKIFNTQHLQF